MVHSQQVGVGGIQLIVSTTVSVYSQLQVSQCTFNNIVSTSWVRPTHEVCWQHGDNDKTVLNVDGSILTNPGKVDYGELVRSFAFYGSVGLSNILFFRTLFMWCI